jgi:hypothetical protein
VPKPGNRHDDSKEAAMGFDRGVLPPDRDQDDTGSRKGVVAAVVILLVLFALFYLSFRVGLDTTTTTTGS